MTALMVRNDIQIGFTQHQRALGTDENLVQSVVEAVLCHCTQVATCCQKRSFVDEVGDVRTNHPRRGTCNRNQVHVLCQWNAAGVNLEDCQAAVPVGALDHHTAVKATGAQERFVQPIWSVGGSNHHNGLARIEAIHLNKQLVQGL